MAAKYPVLNRDNLTIPTEMQSSEKQKKICQFFAAILKSRFTFEHLKKKMTLTAFVFLKLPTLKTWLDKCPKTFFSGDASTNNIVNVPKHCWNLHHTTFIIFIDNVLGNWVGKCLSYWDAQSWDCLLTHWLPMKTILFFVGTI